MGKRGPQKGEQPKFGGRKKGTPNKISAEVKKAIEKAFDELGGSNYLKTVGENDPRTFCTLLGKLVPTTLAGDADNPLIPSKIEQIIVDPKS